MRKLILLAGAAAMAAAMPALAQGRGGGQGGGNGKGGGQAQVEARGGGNARADRGPAARQQREARAHPNRGKGNDQAARQAAPPRGNGHARQAERRAARTVEREQRQELRGADGAARHLQREARHAGPRDWNGWISRSVRGGDRHYTDRFAYWREGRPLPVTLAQGGCPPGLAKQNAFCLPPGQMRKARFVGQPIAGHRFSPVPDEWLYRFRDDEDFYYLYEDDGFVYRVARETNLISSIFPLVATGLTLGEPLPLGYEVYNLPVPYRGYYADSDEWLYRYDDNAIYRVDNDTGLIDSIVALLSGSPLSVGSRLPMGYDVYNVPLAYRDRYMDSEDSLYRYADGGIYEVDPETMLVQALIEMIV